MPFYFFYDPTMIFILIGLVISGIASTYVRSTYSKYADTRNNRGFTAWEVSRSILDNSGLRNVVLDRVPGDLTDHYDSQNNILRLSDATYNSTSVAAIGVAAHEAGHAIQDQENYFPLRLRSTLVPVANFGQGISFPLIIAGVIFGGNQSLINLGILFFSLTLVFQLVTLPVEFDASNRAIAILDQQQLLTPEELDQARHVLRAAALTYVAAAVASFLQVLRLVLLFGGGRRND
ncbi:MAG: zinc metallopeptidase [Desemzia incerta]|uniref:zinc metallopeptidase n=1 Tax=Desemzia TaxID=82800 RepID=UPI001E3C3C3D|nr:MULTISPECIES: zinc metallopeptidase [Desemzia]MCI3028977.1 zinc metallopeptidase [Desemzia sp. C1]WHZ33047.1 zinc metallopeptidase [Desemzia incerta]